MDDVSLTEVKVIRDSAKKKSNILPAIHKKNEIINQAQGDIPLKPLKGPSLLNDKSIITARDDNVGTPGRGGYPVYPNTGQNPYYVDQRVGGQPVYIIRAYEPADASRMPAYRPGFRMNYMYSDDNIFAGSFNEMAIRNRFIKRVYTILTIQLLVSFIFIALCAYNADVKRFVLLHRELYSIAALFELFTFITLVCCLPTRRIFPLNFILLGIFTICLSYMMGFLSAMSKPDVVLMAVGITGGVCFLISVVACQTDFDMTGCGAYLCIFSLVVILFSIAAFIVALATGGTFMFVIYAGLLSLLFSLYLMYDTQMIMGGRRIELSPEEYIFGAISLYTDIMYIFMSILYLLNSCDS